MADAAAAAPGLAPNVRGALWMVASAISFTAMTTLIKYLGGDYKVTASMGHLRDLPKSRLGVDVEQVPGGLGAKEEILVHKVSHVVFSLSFDVVVPVPL